MCVNPYGAMTAELTPRRGQRYSAQSCYRLLDCACALRPAPDVAGKLAVADCCLWLPHWTGGR